VHVQDLFERLHGGCVVLETAISLAALLEDVVDVHGHFPQTGHGGLLRR